MSRPAHPINPRSARGLLLLCFFFSGFTALLYQTVWMRLALAKFGVNTSVVATVLAVFIRLAVTPNLTFLDATSGTGTWEYEVTFTIEP